MPCDWSPFSRYTDLRTSVPTDGLTPCQRHDDDEASMRTELILHNAMAQMFVLQYHTTCRLQPPDMFTVELVAELRRSATNSACKALLRLIMTVRTIAAVTLHELLRLFIFKGIIQPSRETHAG